MTDQEVTSRSPVRIRRNDAFGSLLTEKRGVWGYHYDQIPHAPEDRYHVGIAVYNETDWTDDGGRSVYGTECPNAIIESPDRRAVLAALESYVFEHTEAAHHIVHTRAFAPRVDGKMDDKNPDHNAFANNVARAIVSGRDRKMRGRARPLFAMPEGLGEVSRSPDVLPPAKQHAAAER